MKAFSTAAPAMQWPAPALALWFTLMHTGLLGALLTFAAVPLYGHGPQALWGQQLAGLVMWIPGGVVYLAAAGWMAGRWLRTPPPAVPPGQPTSWGSNTTLR